MLLVHLCVSVRPVTGLLKFVRSICVNSLDLKRAYDLAVLPTASLKLPRFEYEMVNLSRDFVNLADQFIDCGRV